MSTGERGRWLVGGRGNWYTVLWSLRKDLVKSGLGRFKTLARCSPEEKRVAMGEAVDGKGFRRTGEDSEKDEECEG